MLVAVLIAMSRNAGHMRGAHLAGAIKTEQKTQKNEAKKEKRTEKRLEGGFLHAGTMVMLGRPTPVAAQPCCWPGCTSQPLCLMSLHTPVATRCDHTGDEDDIDALLAKIALEEKAKKGKLEIAESCDPPGPRVSASFTPYVTPVRAPTHRPAACAFNDLGFLLLLVRANGSASRSTGDNGRGGGEKP